MRLGAGAFLPISGMPMKSVTLIVDEMLTETIFGRQGDGCTVVRTNAAPVSIRKSWLCSYPVSKRKQPYRSSLNFLLLQRRPWCFPSPVRVHMTVWAQTLLIQIHNLLEIRSSGLPIQPVSIHGGRISFPRSSSLWIYSSTEAERLGIATPSGSPAMQTPCITATDLDSGVVPNNIYLLKRACVKDNIWNIWDHNWSTCACNKANWQMSPKCSKQVACQILLTQERIWTPTFSLW